MFVSASSSSFAGRFQQTSEIIAARSLTPFRNSVYAPANNNVSCLGWKKT